MKPPQTVSLTPGKRVLFLTKDPELPGCPIHFVVRRRKGMKKEK